MSQWNSKETASFIFDGANGKPVRDAFGRQTHVLETAHLVPTRVQMELPAKTDGHK